MAAATVAGLDDSDCIALDTMAVEQVAAEDPDYRLILAKVTGSD